MIIQQNRNIVGGYTDVSWEGNDGWKTSTCSFLFSLVTPEKGNDPKIHKIIDGRERDAIYCDPNDGPYFGNDIRGVCVTIIYKELNFSQLW